ncbi:sensor histidine kinase [Castellaniella sp.]|uniref:sensor histidine kinase n=2 Tax=Castellaniella sp. TaxID=1955812 RepID=UPI003566EBF4
MNATHPSLRWRLLLGTLIWVLLSVAAAGWGIQTLFRQHIRAQLQSELGIYLDHLTAAIQVDPEGRLSLATQPADPRFSMPFSGLYWQISAPAEDGLSAQLLRSRSLWDVRLADDRPSQRTGGDLQTTTRLSSHDALLQMRVRTVYPAEGPRDRLVLSAAADQALWAEPVARFNRELALALGILLLGLMAAVWMQVWFGLRPLTSLRSRLAALRSGQAERIGGAFPAEIQPLVNDLNQVLAQNAQGLERARMQAGNLAHALKTPLSVMANAAAAQDAELPRLVAEQIEAARRQVDYHLVRARAAAAVRQPGLRSPVLPLLQGLVRVMERVHAERALQYDLSGVSADLAFQGEAQDFQEMLGNLLDNAGKWARRTVRVAARLGARGLEIRMEDDGPGLAPGQFERVFERGSRADEKAPGSGLGLGIVRDLAELYGGGVHLERSARLGGACVVLTLPGVQL